MCDLVETITDEPRPFCRIPIDYLLRIQKPGTKIVAAFFFGNGLRVGFEFKMHLRVRLQSMQG